MPTLPRSSVLAKPEVRQLARKLASDLRVSLAGLCEKFCDMEIAALDVASEVTRLFLEDELQAISDQFKEGDEVELNGKRYKSHQPGTVNVPSLDGLLRVQRYTFRACGVRNGPTVVPMDLVAGLVEGATPALAKNVAHAYGDRDMREHHVSLLLSHRAPPSRASLERLATRCGVATCANYDQIEKTVRRAETLPAGAYGISFGIDRTAAPMAEPREPGSPVEPKKKRRKRRLRATPAPIDVNYRMAYVATVAIVDKHGDALAIRRYAMPACDEPGVDLTEGATDDIRSALRDNPNLVVGVVQDGAPEMWNLTRVALLKLASEGWLEDWVEAIDRWHLLERLGKALALFEPDAEKRKAKLASWKEELDTRDSAIDSIQRQLVRGRRILPARHHKAMDEHLTYVRNNKDRMRYVSMSVNGLPVGSGATEGAAKSIVGQRAKKSGQRWGQPGLRGVLKLRCLVKSERFLPFWARLSNTYAANVVHVAVA